MFQKAINLFQYYTGVEKIEEEKKENINAHNNNNPNNVAPVLPPSPAPPTPTPSPPPPTVAVSAPPAKREYATVMLSVHCGTMLKHANAFKSVLLSQGYTVFLCDAMAPGDDYRDEISLSAANCKIFIPFINVPWCKSKECDYEFKIALRKSFVYGVPVLIPIILEDFSVFRDYPSVDGMFCSTNGIVAREPELNDDFWKKMLQAIKKHELTQAAKASAPPAPSTSPAPPSEPPAQPTPPPPPPTIIATIEPYDPSIIANIDSNIASDPFSNILPGVISKMDFNDLYSILYTSKGSYRLAKQKLRGNVFTIASSSNVRSVFWSHLQAFRRQYSRVFNGDSQSLQSCFRSGSGAGFPFQDGSASEASFDEPGRMACYQLEGAVFIIDKNRIRKIAVDGTVSTYAGEQRGHKDGPALEARFAEPKDMAVDQRDGTMYVADFGNHKIRKISPQGEVSTIAGTASGFLDGPGAEAKFSQPNGVALDEENEILFVGEAGNKKIRKIDLSTGEVSTVAGTGAMGLLDGPALEATFLGPTSIGFHPRDNSIFVSEIGNRLVRKISGGQVSTIGVQGKFGERADGSFELSLFAAPTALVVRDRGVYVVDGHTVRKIFL